jgi:hypothetical protein
MRRGTEFHATDRADLFAVARDEVFVGFVESSGDSWRAFDVDMALLDPDCRTRQEAAQECWIGNLAKPQIRYDRVMTTLRRRRAARIIHRLTAAFKVEI